jgi:hypothetical protein
MRRTTQRWRSVGPAIIGQAGKNTLNYGPIRFLPDGAISHNINYVPVTVSRKTRFASSPGILLVLPSKIDVSIRILSIYNMTSQNTQNGTLCYYFILSKWIKQKRL